MEHNDELSIKINGGSDEASVVLTDKNGVKKHKIVVIDDLISQLTSSFKLSTGILPKNTRFFSGSLSNYIIGIEEPSRVRRFACKHGDIMTTDIRVPFPTCLFAFSINGGRLNGSKVFATSGSSILKDTDPLFCFPFGNVYEDGRICWGSNRIPPANTPLAVTGIINLFYDAPFNGDLFDIAGVRYPNSDVYNFHTLIGYMNGKDSFPYSLLQKTRLQVKNLMRD